mmetsp:Transcript_30957/g.88729  ORF Transcript_30957/g.88729 Transcript_30957/m.88729 type:complete len:230 (-) Transcript_30957:72-761(-)
MGRAQDVPYTLDLPMKVTRSLALAEGWDCEPMKVMPSFVLESSITMAKLQKSGGSSTDAASTYDSGSEKSVCSTEAASWTAPSAVEVLTTVMLKQLPRECTRDMLADLLEEMGFGGLFDFIYVPMNLATNTSFTYAFVNLTSPAAADRCWAAWDARVPWPHLGDTGCAVTWADGQQGLAANIERYRNSPVMHPTVPDSCKPACYSQGRRQPFPAPTRFLRAPRARKVKA